MEWRLGLDLGAGSLGWAAVDLDAEGHPCGFLSAGARIYGDGREPERGGQRGKPLAASRRAARSMRRRRDRFLQRQRALIKHLVADGLFPADEVERKALASLDPYALRARALDEKLSLHELGRALFHLNQRRGFQSNRKTDRGKDEDAGKIAIGVDRLKAKIDENGARTFGEFLHLRRARAVNDSEIPSVRTRLRPESGEGVKGDGYDFYPGRQLLKDEYEAIWEAQQAHHSGALTPEVHDRLFEIIFHQRPLKTPAIGMCTLVAGERRLPKAHPLFQRRRLLEELNALMIVMPGEKAERLTPEQRDLLFLKLKDKRRVSFQSLRKTLKLDHLARFNKESENRAELKGDEVAAEMASKTRFGNLWLHLSPADQWDVIQRQLALESDQDEAVFVAWLGERHGLDAEAAKAAARARLPQGYGRFGPTATQKLVDALTNERDAQGRVLVYSEAVDRAGLGHHSDFRTGEIYEEKGAPALPYYGLTLERHIMPGTGDSSDPEEMRVGRLTNPTVHIALNQLRRVVNALIRTYGPPKEIAVELGRELKLSDDEKKRINRENNENRLAAEKRSDKLANLGQLDNGANRVRLKLWEELNRENVIDRRCVYTGKQISIEMLFSSEVEIDHILPFEVTLDDSNANKIVCLREANREKRKRSPYDAWGHTARWPEIAERAARLPRNKRWRFEPDAMQRFADEGGFLARHLVDTQYLGRLANEYLSTLYPGRGEGSRYVWVSPGRLTEMVRRKLGLNNLLPDHNYAGGADQPKNRLDHRHHAIDAAVVAILDLGQLNAIAKASGEGRAEDEVKIRVPEPWPGFRDDLQGTVNSIIVSHRSDHGTIGKGGKGKGQTAGRLHNDTAYGFTGKGDERGNTIVVHRVPLESLKKPADIARVRDPGLQAALDAFTKGTDGKAFETRIAEFPTLGPVQYRRIRRVRVVEPLAIIPIRDAAGREYKGYKGDSNYRYDVWELPDGKWVPDVLSMFEAHQPSERQRPHPAARKVLSLHQDDLIAIEPEGRERRLMRIVKFGQNGQITLAEHNEAGDLKRRDAAPDDPFKYSAPTAGGLKKCVLVRYGLTSWAGSPIRDSLLDSKKVRPPADWQRNSVSLETGLIRIGSILVFSVVRCPAPSLLQKQEGYGPHRRYRDRRPASGAVPRLHGREAGRRRSRPRCA